MYASVDEETTDERTVSCSHNSFIAMGMKFFFNLTRSVTQEEVAARYLLESTRRGCFHQFHELLAVADEVVSASSVVGNVGVADKIESLFLVDAGVSGDNGVSWLPAVDREELQLLGSSLLCGSAAKWPTVAMAIGAGL
jgi:hypothetical protein